MYGSADASVGAVGALCAAHAPAAAAPVGLVQLLGPAQAVQPAQTVKTLGMLKVFVFSDDRGGFGRHFAAMPPCLMPPRFAASVTDAASFAAMPPSVGGSEPQCHHPCVTLAPPLRHPCVTLASPVL
eukprot:gene16798-biopygen13167